MSRETREKMILDADSLSSLDCPKELSAFTRELSARFVDGELSAEEMAKRVVDHYRQ